MGTVQKFNNLIECFEKHTMGRLFERINYMHPKRKSVYSKVKLTAEQKRQIDEYYLKHYGKKIPYIWHQFYYGISGSFDVRYFPELLFIPEFEWVSNPPSFAKAFSDKNLLSQIFASAKGVYLPETLLSCANGLYRSSDGKAISFDEAAVIFENIGRVFVKPSIDSDSGRNCNIYDMHHGMDSIGGNYSEEILRSYGRNFTVQKILECSDSVSTLNPCSVNTFRIMTYRIGDSVPRAARCMMRIGRDGKFVDNAHAGGIFIGVEPDGRLTSVAYTDYCERFTAHPDSGLVFEGCCVPEFPDAVRKAVELHALVPQLGVISWDFTIAKDHTPVLIEMNTASGCVWAQQMTCGVGLFGDDTDAILEFLREKRKLYPCKYR